MRIAIIGAGGHSREVADLVHACGQSAVGFVDDRPVATLHVPTGLPVTRNLAGIKCDALTIAVGDPSSRQQLYDRFSDAVELATLIHPSASVSPHAVVGEGSQIMQNVVVSACASVGRNVILNVGCFVAHDCTVGAHSHVAPGVLMSGGSSCGARCTLGAGSILLPNVKVGDDCVVGAGAVVARDVPAGNTVAGVPARLMGEQ